MISPTQNGILELSDSGFTLYNPDNPHEDPSFIEWELIREIVAYRRDPDGLDLVCLGFRVTAFNQYIEINEEMQNYGQIIERMYEKCQGISYHWWHEIAGVYGTNRTTIYGIPASEQHKPSAAEQYLMRKKKRKLPNSKQFKDLIQRTIVLAVVALIQVLIAWAITNFDSTTMDEYIAIIALPTLLTIMVARIWPIPKIFFCLQAGFYLFEWGINKLLGISAPTLLGEILAGKLGWCLLIGIQILLAMFVMLLPDKRAAGKPFKTK